MLFVSAGDGAVPRTRGAIMSTKSFTEALTAAWNSGDIDRIAARYADDAVLDHVLFPEPVRGRAAIAQAEGGMFAAFSEIDWKVVNVVGDGDALALEWVVKATHTGAMPTPEGPLAPTGRRITVRGSSHMRVTSGDRIASEHRYLDGAGMFAQLMG
jgi:steroid delta-isomerase-like uncharacterized protein